MFDGELGRQSGDHDGGHVGEKLPRDVLDVLLFRERLAEVVLRNGSALEEERPDPSSREVLHAERAREIVLGDEIGPDEQLTETGHSPSIMA